MGPTECVEMGGGAPVTPPKYNLGDVEWNCEWEMGFELQSNAAESCHSQLKNIFYIFQFL